MIALCHKMKTKTNHWQTKHIMKNWWINLKNSHIYQKSTDDFFKKLETHFKNKKNDQEWTSFLKTIHNLFTQHIGKISRKDKYTPIKDKERDEYFYYLLQTTNAKGYFSWKIFKDWVTNNWKTQNEMNDYWMVKIDIEKLKDDLRITQNKDSKHIEQEDQETFCKIFCNIYKNLEDTKFGAWIDGGTTKTRYCNNIQHFINNYANSNKCSQKAKNLIKSNENLNDLIYNIL